MLIRYIRDGELFTDNVAVLCFERARSRGFAGNCKRVDNRFSNSAHFHQGTEGAVHPSVALEKGARRAQRSIDARCRILAFSTVTAANARACTISFREVFSAFALSRLPTPLRHSFGVGAYRPAAAIYAAVAGPAASAGRRT
jgi:hypothetical protein